MSSFPSRLRARSFAVLVAAGLLELALAGAIIVPGASADAGPKNLQTRTFTCDDGNPYNTYTGTFVGGAGGNFNIVGSTNVFVFKTLTSGGVTYNYGIKGKGFGPLITCSYTDPAGVLGLVIFSGWITPRG